MNERQLTLKEKYLLMAYHPEKGRPLNQYLAFGLAGAILLELAEMERITLKGTRIILNDATRHPDQVLDLVIRVITSAKRTKKVPAWINRFVRFRVRRKLKSMVLDEMVTKRVMKREEARFLFLFRYFKYFPYETNYRNELIRNIREKVLWNKEADKEVLLLVALVGATFLINKFFERSERKLARKRIKEIVAENGMATITNETVKAIKGAIVASIIASTAATTAAASASSH